MRSSSEQQPERRKGIRRGGAPRKLPAPPSHHLLYSRSRVKVMKRMKSEEKR